MAFSMETNAIVTFAEMPASSALATPPDAVTSAPPGEDFSSIETMIASELPAELQQSARQLLRAIVSKVAVAEYFDAFCGQVFSKPEWAATASPVIAEMFGHDEDQLAVLARIPDLVIEMGSGQANVTCAVASRWAARGETHRLSKLADSIVASHASKNACAVEVMLALSATLAVTRLSRAEQLYHAALPLAGDEHQEAIADAKHWLAAGRVVCSAPQNERDFWDARLRKPKTVWSWQSKEEQQALNTLSETLMNDPEGAHVFKAVLPACWWDLAVKYAQQQDKLAGAMNQAAEVKAGAIPTPRVVSEPTPASDKPARESPPHPPAHPYARFVLGWICGAMAMAITVLLPSESVNRVLNTFKGANSFPTAPAAPFSADDKALTSSADKVDTAEEKPSTDGL